MSLLKVQKLEAENQRLKQEIQYLSVQKDKYQELFNISADALSILDLDTGRFIECNQSAIDMHGVDNENNFLHLKPSDLSPKTQPCGRASEELAIDLIGKTFSEGPQLFQWTHSKLDGSSFPCLVSLTALPIKDRKLVLAIGRDISEIINIQTELAKANEAKSVFLANMSHELRTPMTTVLGYTDLLLEDNHLSNSTRDSCNKIKYATSSLLGIINEILDMSKLESGYFELECINFNFSSFVKDVVSMFENNTEVEAKINWQLTIDPSIPEGIHSDPTRLKQVLLNIIGNAKKFTKVGHISINCEQTCNLKNQSVIKISITDTGIGISDVIKEKIFDPFSQADSSISRQYSGTGLGLPISKKIVELLGGKIHLESIQGEGSVFSFTFPLIPATSQIKALQKSPSSNRYKATRSLNILFAEDNRVNQALAKKVISSYGHSIDIAENGRLAIEAHKANNYDLILMDVRMPEMDGLEATRNIRSLKSNKSNIPIIAVTADAMNDKIKVYLDAGMSAFSSKPFNWPKLLMIMNDVLGEEVHVLESNKVLNHNNFA